jgi:phenylacetate-CoA ligase
MFVHPEQVAAVVSRHAEIGRARLVVSTDNERDRLVLHCETSAPNSELADAVQQSLRDLCKLRGEVEFVGPNTLANDGKVIDDQRTYD